MTPKATYTPPPPQPQGTLTLEMDEATAKKLMAFLGRCNGNAFNEVYETLDAALPTSGRVYMKSRHNPYNAPDINFHTDYHFSPY